MAKTMALISCTVTAQMICAFVFAYAKSRLSHEVAHVNIKLDFDAFGFKLVVSLC